MKVDVKVESLDSTKDDKDMYLVSIKTYNQSFISRLEKSDVRYLIERLDNGIN